VGTLFLIQGGKQLPKHILVMTVSFVLASSGDMFRKSTIGFEAGILTVSDLTKAHGVGGSQTV